jgi:hypothetical protein
MMDRYSGDPRIIIGKNGWTLDYEGGQPIMDQGIENEALQRLLTRKGWCGNLFLYPASQIGSDFLDVCEAPITLQSVTTDIPNAAVRALQGDLFPAENISVTVTNPSGWNLSITINLGSGVVLTLDRRGMLWTTQATNPASARLVKTS